MGDVEYHSHLALKVKDLERSVSFYTEVVGCSIRERSKPGEPPLVVLTEGLGLKQAAAGSTTGAGHVLDHVAFKVKRLDSILARLEAAGLRPTDGPRPSPYGNSVYFLDPDGNKLECHDGERK